MKRRLPIWSIRLEQATAAARTAPVAAASAEQVQQYKKAIAELEHRLELMVEKNPVPMLLTTPVLPDNRSQ